MIYLGYKIEHVPSTDKQFAISMSHPRNPSLLMSASNQMDMMKWFEVLEAVSKTNQTDPTDTTEDNDTTDLQVKTTETNSSNVSIILRAFKLHFYSFSNYRLQRYRSPLDR